LILAALSLLPPVGGALAQASDAAGVPGALIDEWFREAAPGDVLSKDFTAAGGQWDMDDGELRIGQSAGGPKAMYGPALPDEMEASVEVFLPGGGGGNAGLIVRVADAAEGADNFTGYEVAIQADGALILGRHRHNFEGILSKPAAWRGGGDRWVPLRVRTKGRTLEVAVDGEPLVRYEDTEHPLAPGRVGFRVWDRTARFRNFRVSTGGGPSQPVGFSPAASGADSITTGVSANWSGLRRGNVRSSFALAGETLFPEGRQQQITFEEGTGDTGILTPSVGLDGFPVVAGKDYHGVLWVRSPAAVQLHAGMEANDGTVLADASVAVEPDGWRTLRFELSPTRDCDSARLALKLNAPGKIDIARVSLSPGDWAWPASLSRNKLPPILFATHAPFSPGPAVGTNIWAAKPLRPGCGIHIWDPARADTPARTLFNDPQGSIYDLNLSYDARSVLFTYQRKEERYWHIWRIGVDGSELKQLTDGPFHDINPCELPDGSIVFVSTRRFGHTVCQPGPASNLHRMAADGGGIKCVSMNTLSDLTPQMLPSGRVLFTRWEYIDRDLTYRQSLWTQNPDGTVYQLYFGNTIRDPGTFWQARPIPGQSQRVLATFGPHHGCIQGAIGWIDTSSGPEAPRGVGFDWITHEFPSIGDRAFPWSYCDPYPLDGESFLCSYGGGGLQQYRLYLHDMQDRKRLLYEDPALGCYNPIPLRATPLPPLLPSRAAIATAAGPAEQATGTMLLVDVYQGIEPMIRRGQVTSIRIMEQVRKTEDLVLRAFDQSPVMSYGTYYAKRSWGIVPVEDDGSAYFVAPALREIYFQALDAEGRELQRMTSAAQLMPGEHVSCVGCHENRVSAPPPGARVPLAAKRAPSVPVRPGWAPDGIIDFVSTVQPVLDQYCVSCHEGGNPAAGYDFSGDKTRFFNAAYDNLLGRSRSYRQHDMDTGEMLAAERAKGQPLVHFYWLLRTPTAVNQPLWAGSHASRLTGIIEAAARKMPLAERQKIYTWMDADVPYYGTYAHARPQSAGRRDLLSHPTEGRLADWFTKDLMPVFQRRCVSCHPGFPGNGDFDGMGAWVNFTRPRFSPLLTAHLTKSSGGRGIDTTKDGKPIPGFVDTDDADYRILLGAIEEGRRAAEALPEPDMPGYTGRRKEP
jgi:hypothetical protein